MSTERRHDPGTTEDCKWEETGRNATNTMLCWDSNSSHVALVPWPDVVHESATYEHTDLACMKRVPEYPFPGRKLAVFITAIHAIVRDHVDPQALHVALLGLDEYRSGCSDDMPGMSLATPHQSPGGVMLGETAPVQGRVQIAQHKTPSLAG